MKTLTRFAARMLAAVATGVVAASSAYAIPILVNGGFEAGFTGWTTADQLGSDGTFFIQSGTASPINGDPVPPPPEGASAAMTDAAGPGSHVLYQDFLAAPGAAILSFALFIGNRDTDFFAPSSLDFSTPALNQQARVDIVRVSADPFSVALGDVLLNVYQTRPGDPLVSGYNAVAADISALLAAHAGETLRLRFAESDNVLTMQMGVDNVRFVAAEVSEPASTLLLAAALMAFGGARRNRT